MKEDISIKRTIDKFANFIGFDDAREKSFFSANEH